MSSVLKFGGSAVTTAWADGGAAVSSRIMGTTAGRAMNYASAATRSRFGAQAAEEFTPAVGIAGREGASGAVQGGIQNTGSYFNSDGPHNASGAMTALTYGSVTSGLTGFGGTKLKNMASAARPIAQSENSVNALSTNTVINYGAGFTKGAANYALTPNDDPSKPKTFGTGLVAANNSGMVSAGSGLTKASAPSVANQAANIHQNLTNPLGLMK